MDTEMYNNLLNNIDALLAEDGPTLEELEIQALVFLFCLQNTRDTDGLNVLDTGRRVSGDPDGPSIQFSLVSPPEYPFVTNVLRPESGRAVRGERRSRVWQAG